MLVYDIARRDTYFSAMSWLADVKEHGDPKIAIVLVGNKSDLGERNVSREEAQTWADENGITAFIEASAKTGDQVTTAFTQVAKEVYERIKNGTYDLNDRVCVYCERCFMYLFI